MHVLRITWSNSVRRYSPVGKPDTVDAAVVDVARREHVPRTMVVFRVRRNYKNKYPDSLYVTIWILYGAGIET